MSSKRRLSSQDEKRVWLFASISFALAAAHVLVWNLYFHGVLGRRDWVHVMFFDLDAEQSFGTWFTSMILLYAGRLLWERARAAKAAGGEWYRSWLWLSVGFHFLSIDEVVCIHEYVNTVVVDTPWTTFGAVIVVVLAVVYFPLLRALPRQIRVIFIAAALLYVVGAVGIERASGWYETNQRMDTLAYNTWTMVEETMEMAGVIVFIYGLLLLEPEWNPRSSREPE